MSTPSPPKPAKLIIGAYMADKRLLPGLATELTAMFGAMDIISAWLDFDFTTYYAQEMGTPLFRRMMAFKTLIAQDQLASVKVATNRIEQGSMADGCRKLNIDPGYLLSERFVLATGKNFSHRIYLQQGIYADLTLIYTRGDYQALPWTYPDYSDANMIDYLKTVRKKYKLDLQQSTISTATAS